MFDKRDIFISNANGTEFGWRVALLEKISKMMGPSGDAIDRGTVLVRTEPLRPMSDTREYLSDLEKVRLALEQVVESLRRAASTQIVIDRVELIPLLEAQENVRSRRVRDWKILIALTSCKHRKSPLRATTDTNVSFGSAIEAYVKWLSERRNSNDHSAQEVFYEYAERLKRDIRQVIEWPTPSEKHVASIKVFHESIRRYREEIMLLTNPTRDSERLRRTTLDPAYMDALKEQHRLLWSSYLSYSQSELERFSPTFARCGGVAAMMSYVYRLLTEANLLERSTLDLELSDERRLYLSLCSLAAALHIEIRESDLDELPAFLISTRKRRVAYISNILPCMERVWAIAHELGHYVFQHRPMNSYSGLVGCFSDAEVQDYERQEQEADAWASVLIHVLRESRFAILRTQHRQLQNCLNGENVDLRTTPQLINCV